MARLVEHLTLDFSSGCGIEPRTWLCAEGTELAWGLFSLSLSLSLSLKKKKMCVSVWVCFILSYMEFIE